MSAMISVPTSFPLQLLDDCSGAEDVVAGAGAGVVALALTVPDRVPIALTAAAGNEVFDAAALATGVGCDADWGDAVLEDGCALGAELEVGIEAADQDAPWAITQDVPTTTATSGLAIAARISG
ncbi:hypothetical protein G8A07_14415 [Roseateles sp. DAIF2]|uniref:hypothetical protein n=1 Tax=Roseateles sp. DAIF2 TaxID=2714952 RepID=UPI0018A28CB3|nr:hypothetical protein [Roseateles sp. DAIF2]QPF73990.1 hypothetical protein G8A07_14415 [Roseateles sp. DAIF2]